MLSVILGAKTGARCYGQVVGDGDTPHDDSTPPRLRSQVLARDGQRCRCCGSGHRVTVHHIEFRSHGGRTRVWNLLTLCVRCHSLVHAKRLRIEGRSQKKARFVDREGRPIHNPGRAADASVLLEIAAPERAPSDESAAGPRGEWTTLDGVPEEVDPTWWRRHADLIKDQGAQGLHLKPGQPARETSEDETPAERVPFDAAFRGIVGQDAFLERLREEAQGAAV